MAPTIRPMTGEDLEATVAAVLDGGWGDRRSWFDFALGHPECDPILAIDDGTVVGTGVGTRNGRTGWVGTIFVVPDRRREGIGRGLSEAVCDRLVAGGCETILLVATDQGRPVYERLGFEVDAWYRTLEIEGTGGGIADNGIRRFGPVDVTDAAALDAIATGEDRAHLFRAFASVPGGLALRAPTGELQGFVVRGPWGGGATVAATGDDAVRLVAARRAAAEPGHRIRAGVLESNAAGLQRLAHLGWVDVRRVVRMRRGAVLDWRPDWIWGQFNFAVG